MRHFFGPACLFSPLTFLLILAGAFFALAFANGADAATRYRLTYVGYLAGIPTATAQIQIAAEAGQAPAHKIEVTMQPFGLLKSTASFNLAAAGQSALGKNGLRDKDFVYVLEAPGLRQQAHVTNNGKHLTLETNPRSPFANEARLLDASLTDPVNGLWTAFDGAEQGCDGVTRVFDGYRRYDIDLSAAPNDGTVRNPFSDAPVWRCHGKVTLREGFSPQEVEAGFYPDHADAWVAEIVEGLPPLPLRISAPSGFGMVEVVLNKLEPI